MTTKEEQIIKAIKHELSGLCLDIELNSDIDFNKQDIYGKLYSKYNFTSAEISQALKNYQSNSTDPYLFPFSFSCKGNYIIPLNEITSILKYCKKISMLKILQKIYPSLTHYSPTFYRRPTKQAMKLTDKKHYRF